MGFSKTRQVLDKTCEVHGCQIWAVKIPSQKGLITVEQCPDCETEAIARYQRELDREAAVKSLLARGYDVFARESMFPSELVGKSFDNYEMAGDKNCEAGLNFAKRMVRHYLKGGSGNAILTGPPGVGKSHLTMGMAVALNEQFKATNQVKSVVFVSLVQLFTALEAAFKVQTGLSESHVVDLLSRVDVLVLDDLGKESGRQANEWRQRVLFKILDQRQLTIINTNLSSDDIVNLYEPALADRIFKGVTHQSYAFPRSMESRRY